MSEFIDKNAKLLNLLREQKSLSASSIKSKSIKEIFLILEQTGVIRKRRKGAGNQYQLLNESTLERFINSHYPSGIYKLKIGNTPRRVQGIRQSQNSKSLNKLDFSLITLRGNSLVKQGEKVYDLAQLTTNNAFLCLKLTDKKQPKILQKNSTIITVENPTAFTELDSMLQIPWNIAIYTNGKMSNILLEQLKNWERDAHNLVHFGDYDYVGLKEFARILQLCPKATLYFPDKISAELLSQFGNKLLLEKQINEHRTLINNITNLPESIGKTQLLCAYKLLQENAKGLEQESFYK